jgi:hypothetical protein
LTQNGLHDATTDEDIIRGWWAKHPRANVAIATGAESGIVVLDTDRKGDVDGLRSLISLGIDPRPFFKGLAALTGSKGRHFYFKHPGGVVPCSSGKMGPNRCSRRWWLCDRAAERARQRGFLCLVNSLRCLHGCLN